MEQPDKGQIFIVDDEITAKGANVDAIRMRMGMVYQGFHLFEHMDVLENIILAPTHLRKISRLKAEEKAMELLRMVGLESKRNAMPNTLSGGQKQLIVAHEMGFAREVATRVLYFDECGIYEECSATEFFDNLQKPKTQEFIHKLKYFSQHVDRRDFDFMPLYIGLRDFSTRYGFSKTHANRLPLGSEDLIHEMLSGGTAADEPVDSDISVEYNELDKTTLLAVSSPNPVRDMATLGHTAAQCPHPMHFLWSILMKCSLVTIHSPLIPERKL